MKVRVLIKFTDKYTREKYRVGDIIEVNGERYAEILKKGKLVEKVIDEPQKEVGHLSKNELKSYKMQELKSLARDMGLSNDGKKEDLIERICGEEVFKEGVKENDRCKN